MFAPYPPDGLAAFAVSLAGDGAGVHNADVCARRAGDFVPSGAQKRLHCLGVKLVGFTAQRKKCEIHGLPFEKFKDNTCKNGLYTL
jgi:hypothetical protein